MKKAISISILIHSLLALLAGHFAMRLVPTQKKPSAKIPIAIDWVDAPTKEPDPQDPRPFTRSPRRSTPRSGHLTAVRPNLGLRGFGLQDLMKPSPARAQPILNGMTTQGEKKADGQLAKAPSGALLSGKAVPALQKLYQTIDSQLTYPDELIETDHKGKVAARLHFDSEGNYTHRPSLITSADPYLRVLVSRALRTSLKDHSIKESIQTAQDLKLPLEIEAYFDFEFILHGDDDLIHKRQVVNGKAFSFYRATYKSMTKFSVGPVVGDVAALGVGLNVFWFLDQGTELLSKKAKIDPLEKYRMDSDW